MKFRVKLYWEMCGEVEVEADSVDQAIEKAVDGPLPQSSEYVMDSANADPIDVHPLDAVVHHHTILTQEKWDGIRSAAIERGFDEQLAHIKEVERQAFQTQPGSCPP